MGLRVLGCRRIRSSEAIRGDEASGPASFFASRVSPAGRAVGQPPRVFWIYTHSPDNDLPVGNIKSSPRSGVRFRSLDSARARAGQGGKFRSLARCSRRSIKPKAEPRFGRGQALDPRYPIRLLAPYFGAWRTFILKVVSEGQPPAPGYWPSANRQPERDRGPDLKDEGMNSWDTRAIGSQRAQYAPSYEAGSTLASSRSAGSSEPSPRPISLCFRVFQIPRADSIPSTLDAPAYRLPLAAMLGIRSSRAAYVDYLDAPS